MEETGPRTRRFKLVHRKASASGNITPGGLVSSDSDDRSNDGSCSIPDLLSLRSQKGPS